TIHQTEVPPVAGPSVLALSITPLAIPDSISQDGASQSSIQVTVLDANSRPIPGVTLRADMSIGGVVQAFGTLSARTTVTGTDGKARTIYTGPPAPPANLGGSGTKVTIVVTATGTNFQTAQPTSVDIRLVPPGVILPPADTPTPQFSVTPTPVVAKIPARFDGS